MYSFERRLRGTCRRGWPATAASVMLVPADRFRRREFSFTHPSLAKPRRRAYRTLVDEREARQRVNNN